MPDVSVPPYIVVRITTNRYDRPVILGEAVDFNNAKSLRDITIPRSADERVEIYKLMKVSNA